MTQLTLTRRQTFTGTAAGTAAIVAGTGAALADDDHDRAEWLALWRDFIEREKQWHDACERQDGAKYDARREHPVPPTILQRRVSDELLLDLDGKPLALTRDELDRHHAAVLRTWGDHPIYGTQVVEGHKRRLAALKAHKAACRRVDRRFNVPALDAAEKAARRALQAAEDAIAERSAHSMVGFAVKLAKWVRYDGSSPYIGATLDDVPSENRPVIMAYRDAARIAGLSEDLYAEGLS